MFDVMLVFLVIPLFELTVILPSKRSPEALTRFVLAVMFVALVFPLAEFARISLRLNVILPPLATGRALPTEAAMPETTNMSDALLAPLAELVIISPARKSPEVWGKASIPALVRPETTIISETFCVIWGCKAPLTEVAE